jgi:hypothetical protein
MFTKTRHFNPSFVNTVEKDKTYHGHWWVPEQPHHRVSGVLYVQKSGGIKLHLIGMFENDASETLGHTFADHYVILGDLVPGNATVSLANCKERQRKSPYMANISDGAVQQFRCDYMVIGQYLSKDQMKFSSFEFCTTYLVGWANLQQTKQSFSGNESVVTTIPRQDFMASYEGNKITLSSWALTDLAEDHNSTTQTSISVDVIETISFETFKENFLTPLADLVQFGSALLNSVTFITVTPPNTEGGVKLTPTHDFDRIEHEKEPVIHYSFFLFSDVQNVWGDFLPKWMALHSGARHIFRLYFDSLHIGPQFPVTKFLNIVQATESFHAERSKNDSLLLRTRLQALLDESDGIMSAMIADFDAFISRTVDTRNYYTHYSTKKKERAAEGLELLALTFSLRLLLNYHILAGCGLDKSLCRNLIEKNHYYTQEKNSFAKIIFGNSNWLLILAKQLFHFVGFGAWDSSAPGGTWYFNFKISCGNRIIFLVEQR